MRPPALNKPGSRQRSDFLTGSTHTRPRGPKVGVRLAGVSVADASSRDRFASGWIVERDVGRVANEAILFSEMRGTNAERGRSARPSAWRG
jgi:hypothetical protein